MTPAQRKRIEAIAKRDGILRPQALVEDAEDPASPLHSCFTWDANKALEKCHLQEARALIREVKFWYTPTNRTVVEAQSFEVKRFVRDPESARFGEQGYLDVQRLKTNRPMAHRALQERLGGILGSAREAVTLARYLGLEVEMVRLVERIQDLLTQVRRAA